MQHDVDDKKAMLLGGILMIGLFGYLYYLWKKEIPSNQQQTNTNKS